jgi:hypothetical protein
LFLGSLQFAQRIEPPIFRPISEIKAFEEIRAVSGNGDVVLASYETGNALPAWAPLSVVAGHGPESVDLEHLLPKIQTIYQGRTGDDTRLEFFLKYNVDFVFWGPNEQRLGSWLPAEEDYLVFAVDVGEYEIYKVSEEALQ